jgi:tetratricopeptide (TPR) repeat protein
LQAELSASASQIRAMSVSNPSRWHRTIAMAAAAAVILIVLGIRWNLKPNSPTRVAPTQATKPGPAVVSLAELAHFDPPAYRPAVLRSTPDEALREFQKAMKPYQQGDYARAAALLTAAKLNPKDPGVLFFLGVSHLLAGQTDDGIAVLKRCVALGDTPYLEEAHYYLGKGLLGKGDLTAARRELEEAVRLKGEREGEAQRLLQQLAVLGQDSH